MHHKTNFARTRLFIIRKPILHKKLQKQYIFVAYILYCREVVTLDHYTTHFLSYTTQFCVADVAKSSVMYRSTIIYAHLSESECSFPKEIEEGFKTGHLCASFQRDGRFIYTHTYTVTVPPQPFFRQPTACIS
jgi:hypothetical protein